MTRTDISGKSNADKLSALQIRYQVKLESMIADIQFLWETIEIPTKWTKDLSEKIDQCVYLSHKIAGSAGTFGFSAVSKSAGPLELLFQGVRETKVVEEGERVSQINCLVNDLKSAFDGTLTVSCIASEISKTYALQNTNVYIIYSNEAEAIELGRVIGHFGYEVTIFLTVSEAYKHLEDLKEPPLACILEINDEDAGEDSIELLKKFNSETPFLALSEIDDFKTRLKVVEAGSSAFLTIPMDTSEIVEWLENSSAESLKNPYKVLIIDDDEFLAQSFVLSLEMSGIEAKVLGDVSSVLDVLSDYQPDIILMDIYMPDCLGTDLAKLIRQQKQFTSIPIMFLSVEHEMTRQYRALLFGGDDFLTKPISSDQLVLAVTTRAARSRALRGIMERDGLTGLLNHAIFKERLGLEIVRAKRDHEPLSMALVDLDRFKSVNDTYGHQAGDKVLKTLSGLLKRRLRKTDIIGRYGGEEFGIIMPNTDDIQASSVLEDLRIAYGEVTHRHLGQEFKSTFSAGISVMGEGSEVDTLIETSDKNLYLAKEKGRNKVVF